VSSGTLNLTKPKPTAVISQVIEYLLRGSIEYSSRKIARFAQP